MKYLAGILLWSALGYGAILELKGSSGKTLADKIAVAPEAAVTIAGAPALPKLVLTGAGVRKKKIVLVKVSVYAAASYLDSSVKLNQQNPMESMRKAKAKALHLTFLRDIDSEKIRSSFGDALKKNNVDLENPAIKKALAVLDFDVKEGQTLSLVGYKKNETTDALVFETPGGPVTLEGPDVSSLFWQIWFGIPEDSGLENLKAELVGQGEG